MRAVVWNDVGSLDLVAGVAVLGSGTIGLLSILTAPAHVYANASTGSSEVLSTRTEPCFQSTVSSQLKRSLTTSARLVSLNIS